MMAALQPPKSRSETPACPCLFLNRPSARASALVPPSTPSLFLLPPLFLLLLLVLVLCRRVSE